jgi:hypothetical protein
MVPWLTHLAMSMRLSEATSGVQPIQLLHHQTPLDIPGALAYTRGIACSPSQEPFLL